MLFSILNKNNLQDISSELLLPNQKIKLFNSEYYKNIAYDDFRYFCHNYARYGIPTIELITFLKEKIMEKSVIEIGAGAGDLGFHLGIHMTDSKQQEDPFIVNQYKAMKQPIIKYPKDVEKIDALDAVKKYKPQIVVASWITPYSPIETSFGSNPFGVKEPEILKLVETFIIIGNSDIHGDKPILKNNHEKIKGDWIISRAKYPENNCIYVLNNK